MRKRVQKTIEKLQRFLTWLFPWRSLRDTYRRFYRLEVEAKESELLAIKDFIQRICDAAGCNNREAANVKLAVDEACTNIIRHAYEGKAGGKINLEAGVGSRDLKIIIRDRGRTFDIRSVKDPDLERYVEIGKKGGLGLWLIRKVMDSVSYERVGEENVLTLVRRFSKAPPPALGVRGRYFSVSVKFTLGAVALVVLAVGAIYFGLSSRQEQLYFQEQSKKMQTLLSTLSQESGDSLLYRRDLELNRLMRTMQQEMGAMLRYFYVTDADGRVLVHTDSSRVFQKVDSLLTPKNGEGATWSVDRKENLWLFSAEVQHRGRKVGEMHAALDIVQVARGLASYRAGLRKTMLLVFLVSLIGIYLLSLIVTRPLQRIFEGIQALSAGEVQTRIDLKTQDEFGQLAAVLNEMAVKIQESQSNLREQERLYKEMQVAQSIQHALLPKEFPKIEGYEIGAFYRSAKEVGGDYYDFFWVDPTTLGIVVADVSGKGVPGSLVMTMIRTAMRLEARGNKSAADVLARVNTHITPDMRRGMFVTMFYIILDSKNRSINFASAGHNPMILYRGKKKEVYFLKPKGFPLGIDLPEPELFEKSLSLQKINLDKDDLLLIYTDGITEAMNPEKQQFGEDRLVKTVRENAHLSPEAFIKVLERKVAEFTRGAEQHDDITVVAIKEKLPADQALYKFRARLMDLVHKKGLTVAEACRRMNVSKSEYYRYRKLFLEKGRSALRPKRKEMKREIQELTHLQQQKVLNVVGAHPEWGPQKIYQALAKEDAEWPRALIYAFLKRKGLDRLEERKKFAALVDTKDKTST